MDGTVPLSLAGGSQVAFEHFLLKVGIARLSFFKGGSGAHILFADTSVDES